MSTTCCDDQFILVDWVAASRPESFSQADHRGWFSSMSAFWGRPQPGQSGHSPKSETYPPVIVSAEAKSETAYREEDLASILDQNSLSYSQARDKYGAGTKSRTRDLLITNQLLYQLSYTGFIIYIN